MPKMLNSARKLVAGQAVAQDHRLVSTQDLALVFRLPRMDSELGSDNESGDRGCKDDFIRALDDLCRFMEHQIGQMLDGQIPPHTTLWLIDDLCGDLSAVARMKSYEIVEICPDFYATERRYRRLVADVEQALRDAAASWFRSNGSDVVVRVPAPEIAGSAPKAAPHDDAPMSLAKATRLPELAGEVTVAALRGAISRGELEFERHGRNIKVTPRMLRIWRQKCRQQKAPTFTTIAPVGNGRSATPGVSSSVSISRAMRVAQQLKQL